MQLHTQPNPTSSPFCAFSGSDVIIDGVLAEKLIVYTDGIGISKFLEFRNVAVAAGLAKFMSKIRTMVQNLEAYGAEKPLARNFKSW